jgi:hypothetical protein
VGAWIGHESGVAKGVGESMVEGAGSSRRQRLGKLRAKKSNSKRPRPANHVLFYISDQYCLLVEG